MKEKDFTKNKKLLEIKDNNYSQIKEIIENTDVGTWKWNIKTGEMVFSDRWAQIIGYEPNELGPINKELLGEVIHPDDFKRSSDLLNKHFKGELPYYKHENRLKHKNGHWVWICERGCVTSWTEDGDPLIIFGTHTDITKRKEIEQSLENYINTLNHDLRNPLSIILGYSSYLLEDDLSKEDIKKFSTVIHTTGKKMLKMMESYLSFAKIEKGQEIIDKKIKTVAEVIDEIKKNYNDFKNNKKLVIIWDGVNSKIVNLDIAKKSILIDEILFSSIVNNLLHNAIDASPSVEDEITINIYEEDGLCLSFFNKGEIPKEIKKKLFNKFISSKKNGTGIGLYSAKLIAKAHKGDIHYQSVIGGTKFILKIPFN